MSNMAASPGSRPLEQLKVAELRDELRKRGLSLKGVKKELFERLEEAVKKEEQEGIVHGEHEATQEGAHKMGTLDDTEDLEGEEEILDRSKDEASKSHDTATACQSNALPDTPLPTNEESTPFSEETHALPGVSAPDEVPGSNEEREQLCTAGGANVETNNDVLFVDNAVSGNGDAMLSPENAADVLEPCKDTSGVEHVECGNDEKEPAIGVEHGNDEEEPCKDTSGVEHVEFGSDEKEPAIVISELADSERVDVVLESGFASSVIENVISDVVDRPVENGDPFVAVNIAVSANDPIGNDCAMHDVENKNLKEDGLSIPESFFENPSLEVDDKSLVQPLTQALDSGEPVDMSQEEAGGLNAEGSIVSSQLITIQEVHEPSLGLKSEELERANAESSIVESSIVSSSQSIVSSSQSITTQEVHVPSAGLKSEELERANVDERDLITNEENSDVKLEQVVKHDIISGGGLENSGVKMEPMEIETGLEESHEAICEVKMESQIDEAHTQQESPPEWLQLKEVRSDRDYSRRSRGEESARRVPDDGRKDKDDDVNLKPVEDVSHVRSNLKRKDNETDVKQQEPAKRMRRWNSGKEVVVDALKPLTTDSMKEIMLPDSAEGSSTAAQRLTPKAVATSRALPPKVKVEPEPSNNTRTVPPSTRPPSNSLKVDRFVRPFTLKAAKDLLGEFGQCVNFWMDQIKTHCFVTYSSVNEAVAARNGLYGRQWPPSVGNCLVADFVDANEVKMRSEGLVEKAQAAPIAGSMRVSNSTQPLPPRVGQSASSVRSDSSTLPPPRFSRDAQLSPVPKMDPEPAVVTLEDLFCKTKAKPHIYYLPLTDEQVAEKMKNKQAVR